MNIESGQMDTLQSNETWGGDHNWQEQRIVNLGPLLFEFSSQLNWEYDAKDYYAGCGIATIDTVAIDAKGRICNRGKHFMRAKAEGAYPIKVYAIDKREECYGR